MMSLTALTMAIPTQAAEVNSSGYLDTYDKLQEYAWSLQYPEQGPFDIWLVSNEQGGARFVSNVPQTVFGYQIRDFDNDRQVELLIVGTKTESDKLYMQMYEVTNGVVTLQSEIETDGVALFPEEGISRCYSYLNDQNERLIGYDLWYYLSYIADGTNVSTELFQYDGMTLSKVDSYGISGSSGFEDADIVGNYAKRGSITWVIITVIIALVMLFNRKTRVTQILAAQLRVFRNAKTRKTSIWDSICFVVMPVIVAIIISFALGWEINSDTFTGILALILVLIATALEFMFLARRTESDNKVKKQVMDETFVSILTSNVLSLFTAILSIVVLEVYDSIAKKILTACIYSAVLMIAMLILLILKRIFALFIDNDKTI